jgi:phosphomannomutase
VSDETVSDEAVSDETLSDLLARATAWRDQDPDATTRAELDALIADAASESAEGSDEHSDDALSALQDRFARRLEFGTAGLRGEIGAGPNRMNRVLVSQAAAGLAAFLGARESSPSVVIGYDGRTNSQVFALDTAEIMAGAGVRAILLPRLLPTPVLAFAVRHLDVSAGVMVTASHNPAADNGYKVYLGGADSGSQIVPPSDGEIAAQIERIAAGDIRDLPRSDAYELAPESVLDAYVSETAALRRGRDHADFSFVYTAMHGVGWETAQRVFAEAGLPEPTIVTEQIEPDATFPTVAFPNPEEPGAMDLAFATAAKAGADLVIANDPDADRLAVGIPDAAGPTKTAGAPAWRRLSGNEIGWLLGWRAADRAGGQGTLACSIVSSPALAAVAAAYGMTHIETLTGFKWISRAPDLTFGYEEALGYLVDPDIIRDKDGISAAVDLLSLVAELAAEGRTLADHAEDFAGRFGAFASSQISLRMTDLSAIPKLMDRVRSAPPTSIGSVAVTAIDDFETGVGDFPASDILRLWTADGSRVIVRPSGTEPKLKVYIDATSTDGDARERLAAAEAKVAALDAGMRQILEQ